MTPDVADEIPGYTNGAYVHNENFPAVIPARSDISGDFQPQTQPQRVNDFDDLLSHQGKFGTYQKKLFLLMIPFAFFVSFVYFSQIFKTLVPDEHWCMVPELSELTLEQR